MSSKTFFITGANSGFGLAIATAAIQAGHRVIGIDRSQVSRDKLLETLPTLHAVLATSPNSIAFRMFFSRRKRNTVQSTS